MGLCSRLCSFQGLFLAITIFIAVYHQEILEYAAEHSEICEKTGKVQEKTVEVTNDTSAESSDKPKYWLIGDNVDENLQTVREVLDRVGLQRFNGTLKTENNNEGWNLIWSSKTSIPLNWKGIKYHQKFNHFPFSRFLSSKSYFGNTTESKFVPKVFLDSDELRKYAKKNPKSRFLKKSKARGGISYIKDVQKVKFTPDKDFFVQELVQNPLLFDGKMFELSVFVLMTSVNPLRLYYYPHNVIPRFCPEKYDNFDFSDEDSFIVGDSHVPPLDFEGTRDYFLNGYTFKDAIDELLRKQGGMVGDVWKRIEEAIRSVVVSKEKDFVQYFDSIKEMKFPYFELYSFDFIIDKSFNPHIININANPDISSTGKYERFRQNYEALLYNLFKMIGVATPYVKKDFLLSSVELEMMVSHPNTRIVMPEFCIYKCDKTCDGKCVFCMRCMKQNLFYETILAYLEQENVGNFKRLFPPGKEYLEAAGEEYEKGLVDHSQFLVGWYKELCKRNKSFC